MATKHERDPLQPSPHRKLPPSPTMPLPPPGCRDKCSLRHRQRHHNHDAVQRHSYAQATPAPQPGQEIHRRVEPHRAAKSAFSSDSAEDDARRAATLAISH
jgi:hypothetical protein